MHAIFPLSSVRHFDWYSENVLNSSHQKPVKMKRIFTFQDGNGISWNEMTDWRDDIRHEAFFFMLLVSPFIINRRLRYSTMTNKFQ